MLHNTFSLFLNKEILRKITRKALLITLHLNSDEFQGLDSVTLSRWCTGRTVPSLYRQLLISKIFGVLDEYLTTIGPQLAELKIPQYFTKYLSQYDCLYHSVDKIDKDYYLKFDSDKSFKCRMIYHRSMKIEPLKLMASYIDKNMIQLDVEVFSVINNSNTVSSIYLYKQSEPIFRYINLVYDYVIDGSSPNEYIWFGMSYFMSSHHFKVLVGIVMNHILRNYPNKKYASFVVRGEVSMLFFNKIGAIQKLVENKSNHFGNIYVYEIEISKIYCNTSLVKLMAQYKDSNLDGFRV